MASQTLLDIRDLTVEFAARKLLRRPPPIRAVNGVSLSIPAGTSFGLVGESGSGKSTLARAILQLVPVTGGTITLEGRDVTRVARQERQAFRRKVQAVLQDPFSALNPRHRVSRIVGDALGLHRRVPAGARRNEAVAALLDEVGLGRDYLDRYPHEMSGGQCQRIAIARSLAAAPRLIIADEATSALDVSVQSQVINLLEELQAREGVAFLMIAHNLEVVKHMCDQIGVMYLGFLVESGAAEAVYDGPTHPYTQMLIASNPVPDPRRQAERRIQRRAFKRDVEPPSPARLPPGCPFAGRCPAAMDICLTHLPPPRSNMHSGLTRCHLHDHGPKLGGAGVGAYLAGLQVRAESRKGPADAV